MSMDKEALIDDLNSVWNFGVKKGLSKGLKQGRKQQARIDAKNFIAAGVPISTIASCIGLSIDEVKKLAEN